MPSKDPEARKAQNKRHYDKHREAARRNNKYKKEFNPEVVSEVPPPSTGYKDNERYSRYREAIRQAVSLPAGKSLKITLQSQGQEYGLNYMNKRLGNPVTIQRRGLDIYLTKIAGSRETADEGGNRWRS